MAGQAETNTTTSRRALLAAGAMLAATALPARRRKTQETRCVDRVLKGESPADSPCKRLSNSASPLISGSRTRSARRRHPRCSPAPTR